MKSLCLLTTKIWKATKNAQIGVVLEVRVTQGHRPQWQIVCVGGYVHVSITTPSVPRFPALYSNPYNLQGQQQLASTHTHTRTHACITERSVQVSMQLPEWPRAKDASSCEGRDQRAAWDDRGGCWSAPPDRHWLSSDWHVTYPRQTIHNSY